jgi:hypothetical protein
MAGSTQERRLAARPHLTFTPYMYQLLKLLSQDPQQVLMIMHFINFGIQKNQEKKAQDFLQKRLQLLMAPNLTAAKKFYLIAFLLEHLKFKDIYI